MRTNNPKPVWISRHEDGSYLIHARREDVGRGYIFRCCPEDAERVTGYVLAPNEKPRRVYIIIAGATNDA